MFGNLTISLSFLLVLVAADSVLPTAEIEDESRGILAFQKRPTKLTTLKPTDTTATTTVFITTTTTVESLATRYCATTANVSGACRRKRGILEEPSLVFTDDAIHPTTVLGVEQTSVDDNVPSVVDLSSSQIIISQIDSTSIPEEVGQDALQRTNPFLFNLLKVKSTVTTTETLTSTSTTVVTSDTKTFTIVGCTPADFSDYECAQLASSAPKCSCWSFQKLPTTENISLHRGGVLVKVFN